MILNSYRFSKSSYCLIFLMVFRTGRFSSDYWDSNNGNLYIRSKVVGWSNSIMKHFLQSHEEVAIKRIPLKRNSRNEIALVREVFALRNACHKNVS